VIGLLSVVAASAASTADAEDFARSDQKAVLSLKSGVGVSSLPILERLPGDLEKTVAALLPVACGANCASHVRETVQGAVRLRDKGWQLDVSNDGTSAEFVDLDVLARARESGVDKSATKSQADLEDAGRSFIAKNLANVITLGPGEELVAEATSHRTEGGGSPSGQVAPTLVTASRVLFSREINGVPVMGTGSKIAVTFHSDGAVESFRYDWPTYVNTGKQQSMAASSAILQRVQMVTSARSGVRASQAVVVPAAATAATEVPLGPGLQLQRLSCGYFDAAQAAVGSAKVVQAGCYYHAVHAVTSDDRLVRAGFAGAVPAATAPEADSSWPEEGLLRGATRVVSAFPDAARPGPNSRPASANK
jgi:hypothetical protein